jgi:hypothetical protein
MSKPIAIALNNGDSIEGAPVQNLLTGEVIVSVRRADGTLTEERGPPGSYVVQMVSVTNPDCVIGIYSESEAPHDPDAIHVTATTASTTGSRALDAILAKYNKPK